MSSSIKPVHWPARRIPVAVRDELVQEIERMAHAGVIERVEQPTDWISPLVIVRGITTHQETGEESKETSPERFVPKGR